MTNAKRRSGELKIREGTYWKREIYELLRFFVCNRKLLTYLLVTAWSKNSFPMVHPVKITLSLAFFYDSTIGFSLTDASFKDC